MTDAPWFSAMLRFIVVVGQDVTDARRARSLIVVRAYDYDDAWHKALERGGELEQDYEGGTGERVQWLLEKVETVDQLGAEIVSGREIYSEPLSTDAPDPVLLPPDPESTPPGMSGV